jgi:hypothetical protein
MADNDGLPAAEAADHPVDVGGQGEGVVAARGLVAAAVAAQVESHRPVSGGGQPGQLGPPGPPELRKAMQQNDRR